MVREMRGLLRPYGFLRSRVSVGGSVASASEANVSMMRFTQSICTAFRGESWGQQPWRGLSQGRPAPPAATEYLVWDSSLGSQQLPAEVSRLLCPVGLPSAGLSPGFLSRRRAGLLRLSLENNSDLPTSAIFSRRKKIEPPMPDGYQLSALW